MIIAGIAPARLGTCVGNALKWFPDKRASPPASLRRDSARARPDGGADPGDDQGFRLQALPLLRLGQGI